VGRWSAWLVGLRLIDAQARIAREGSVSGLFSVLLLHEW
jgi:hypothetical protein